MTSLTARLSVIVLGLALISLAAGPASSQAPRGHGAEARDMELVGHDDLQGRSAYQPTIHKQGGRFIAYLVSGDLAKTDPLQAGPSGWRTARMTKIYDLSDPAKPIFVRDFGLAGQEPGSSASPVPPGAHGPIALGNRVYFAYGSSADGI